MDTSLKCRKAVMEEGIMPVKSFRAACRRETFQRQYPMWNCSWLPWKWKIISAMDSNMKCKKSGMEEGIMPIKLLRAGWRRDIYQTQCPKWNYSWLPWKWKIISAMGASMKCKKARMDEGIMPLKSLYAWWRRQILYANVKLVWSCS